MPHNTLSDDLLKQVYAALSHYMRTHRVSTETSEPIDRRLPGRFPIRAVILDEDLGSANFLEEPTGSTDPLEPNATVCRWDRDENKYEQTEQRLAVANHASGNSSKDTPGAAIPIDGHYWFFGDCSPISDREPPPWETT